MKCPFCGSTHIFRYRRDADWGGGSSYDTVNGDDDCTGLDTPDIDIYHCRSCDSFFDSHVFPEVQVIPLASMKAGLENLENHVKWLTSEYKTCCETLRKLTANTPDTAMTDSDIPRAVKAVQEAHAKIQQFEEQCQLLRHIMQKHTVSLTVTSTAPLTASMVSPSGKPPITEFRGDYGFLSNFAHSPIVHNGIRYFCVEGAFQAEKTQDEAEKQKLAGMRPSYAKSYGKKLPLRKDWDRVRVNIMRDLLYKKFTQNPELAKKLVATGDAVIMEQNTWGDTFWGMKPDGTGENMLGKLLMEMREHPQVRRAANG